MRTQEECISVKDHQGHVKAVEQFYMRWSQHADLKKRYHNNICEYLGIKRLW